jgi:acyl-CoA synthetase (NDP forming)
VSDNPDAPGVSLFNKLRQKVEAEGGRVYPVNPKVKQLYGLQCFPTIAAIDDQIDLAVIMVRDAVTALRECAEKGCKFVVVFTAGFSETGAEGAAKEAELARIARSAGIRLFGPNTNLNAFETFVDFPGKKVALVTQSGNQGRPIVQGQELGVGFSYWIPTGNEVDLEAADFIQYFATHEETGVVAAYIEGFRDPVRLRRAADACVKARKPIVLIKVGRSEAGMRMAQAHTGHLTGSDRVVDGLFRQYGIVRVDDLDELLEFSSLFARLPRPRGNRVCVYGISGGTSALMSDLLGARGLPVPELAPDTQRRLRAIIPDYLTVRNPVDNGAAIIKTGKGPAIIDAMADDPNTDFIVTPIAGALPGLTETFAEELVELHRSGRKPSAVVWASPLIDDPAFRILVEGRVPLFRSFRNCVKALDAYFAYHAFAERYVSPLDGTGPGAAAGRAVPAVGQAPREAAAGQGAGAAIAGRRGKTGALSEADSKRLLAAYGIPVTREEVARTREEAVAVARRVGFPVAAKISSPDILHKSEAGLVRLGIASEADLERAFAELEAAARAAFPDATIDGILVQEMVHGGQEVMLGVSVDPHFGPTVLFGLGGLFVEALEDVALRPTPLSRADAEAMVGEIRGRKVLQGWRGAPPADTDAIVDAIVRLARLAQDHGGELRELDVNPIMVFPRGQGLKALDALVVLNR